MVRSQDSIDFCYVSKKSINNLNAPSVMAPGNETTKSPVEERDAAELKKALAMGTAAEVQTSSGMFKYPLWSRTSDIERGPT